MYVIKEYEQIRAQMCPECGDDAEALTLETISIPCNGPEAPDGMTMITGV